MSTAAAPAKSAPNPPQRERRNKPLCECINTALRLYFNDLDGHGPPTNLYRMVIEEIEQPLLEAVMEYTHGNQCKASELLGINRSTLRKKLEKHGIQS